MGLRNALDEKQLEAEHLTLELRRAKEKSMLKNTENMNRLRDKYQSRIEHLQKRVAQKEAEELKLRAIIETELTVHRRAGIAGPRSASKGVLLVFYVFQHGDKNEFLRYEHFFRI